MPDDTAPNKSLAVPVSLDRAALDRVLARAAELQAHTAEPSEGMTQSQLEALGAEVGIAPDHIRQAIAEERTRVAVPETRGMIGSWFGPTLCGASRVVRGKPEEVLALLDQWMQKEEGLRPRRRYVDRLTWEARRDFVSSLQAGLNLRGRAYALTISGEVGATVVAIDAERVMVRLEADVAQSRRRGVVAGAITGGGFVASAAGLFAFTTMVPGASQVVGGLIGGAWSLIGVAIGGGIAAAQRRRASRAQLALEQILDRLERGEIRGQGGGGASALLDLLVPTRR